MSFFTNFTQDPQQNINLAQIFIKRKLIEPFDKLSKESMQCYNLERSSKENNEHYIERVGKCLDNWQKQFQSVEDHTNRYLTQLREKEAVHFSRLFHCTNAINDPEVQACRKEEIERFSHELKETFSQL